eukprot:6232338-Prymnesium_polylepis.1
MVGHGGVGAREMRVCAAWRRRCELGGEDRRAMSSAIFYQYCAALLLLPGVLTLFVAFICRTRDTDSLTVDDDVDA